MESAIKRLEKNKHLLFALHEAKPKLRKAILSSSNIDLIKTICEIAFNISKGNYPLTPNTKEQLTKYKKPLRCLSCPKKPLHLKRKVLIQQGGFIPSLIASIAVGLLSKLTEKI